MNKLLLAGLLFFISVPSSPPSAEQLPLDNGIVAVYLKPATFAGDEEFNGRTLLNCLRNHVDYLLWFKGWDFDFVQPDDDLEADLVIDGLDDNRYRYLLYIETDASFQRKRIHAKDDNSVELPEKYSRFLKLKLVTSFYDISLQKKTLDHRVSKGKNLNLWVESPDGGYLPKELTNPEPPDFVIKRILSEALSFLPVYERPGVGGKGDIPVSIVLDKRILSGGGDYETSDIHTVLEYASRSLRRQFGFGLKVCAREYLTARGIPFSGMNALFKSLLNTRPVRNDTMTIAAFRPEMPEQFYESGRKVRIGLSDLGKQVLLIAEISPPNKMTSEWKAFLTGQLLLHEIGHLLGAIHVSDLNSIMAPKTTWVSSDQFDPLNKLIIEDGRKIGLQSRRITEYLQFVTDAVRKTNYRLADYPAMYFSYINLNRKQFQDNSPAGSDFARSIPYAAEGYRLYLLKNYSLAKDFFYKALACDSTQGALHYYLSRVTSGELSKLHLKKSAETGFYRAISRHVTMDKR